jgi:EAL domain-containing protein (putative c-di-GMP-specific phosphodiesterase class I)
VDVVVDRLRVALAEPVRVGAVDLVVTASIGVAFGDGYESADDLLADADLAMYRSKHGVGSRTAAGEGSAPKDRQRSVRRVERQLVQALARGELQVHYQPIVDGEGSLHAVEALLRWHHPDDGLLPAVEFIDLAQRSGVIVAIGRWVIGQVSAQMGEWLRTLGPSAPTCAYVNLSSQEVTDPELLGAIETALAEHQLQPRHLGLELVEQEFVDARVLPVLQELQQRGHPLSVDDFGTGYSSLSRLVELPVGAAKIDKSLVAGIGGDPRRQALVRAVVGVAGSLGLRVVAEGVETVDQADHVRRAGCHYLQGALYGGAEAAEALTSAWRSTVVE